VEESRQVDPKPHLGWKHYYFVRAYLIEVILLHHFTFFGALLVNILDNK
jgi:hypothetical protein